MLKIEITETKGPAYTAKALTDANKAALMATANEWHESMMPKHFEPSAAARYFYQKRAGEGEPGMVYSHTKAGMQVTRNGRVQRLVKNRKYYWRKKYSGHGTTPLVYSGKSEAAAKSVVKLTASGSRGGTITGNAVMPALPRYFYQIANPQAPDKAAELTRTTSSEVDTLRTHLNTNIVNKLNTLPPATTTTRIG